MLDNHDRTWQDIAAEMTDEQDVGKLLQLAKELDQAMREEERKRLRKRLGLDEKHPV